MITSTDLVLSSGTDLFVVGLLRGPRRPLFAGRPRRFHHCARPNCCFRGPWLEAPIGPSWIVPEHLIELSRPGDHFWVGVFTPSDGRQLVYYEESDGVPFDAARDLFEAGGAAGFLALDDGGRPVELLVQERELKPADNWTIVGFYDRDDLLENGGPTLT